MFSFPRLLTPGRWGLFSAWFLIAGVVGHPSASAAESDLAQQMVTKALAYLEANASATVEHQYASLGGTCLVGLAVLKASNNPNHPLVKAAVKKCQEASRRSTGWETTEDNYSLGLSLIFICELDPGLYQTEAQRLLDALLRRQQRSGGWGYHGKDEGDISQIQYAVLGLWIAKRSGLQVPHAAIEGVCDYLIRVQGPRGEYGYQAADPGNYTRIQQQDNSVMSRIPRPVMAAAGTGSLYMCSELLGFVKGQAEEQDPTLPSALRAVRQEEEEEEVTTAIDSTLLQSRLQDGDRWFNQVYRVDQGTHQAYYMYALERYQSFRAFVHRSKEKEPAWYRQGVLYLSQKQEADGSWQLNKVGNRIGYGSVLQTSFASLFLLRSAQNTIRKIVEESGRTRGGKSLPKDLTTIRIDQRTGQVIDTSEKPPIETLLEELESEDLQQSEYVRDMPEKLELSEDDRERAAQRARLRRLIMGGPFQARLTAANTLGRDRNLDNAPVLIFALSDPDWRVAKAARDGLRFLSRKMDGFGLPSKPERHEWQEAQKKWSQWLLSVDPDAQFIE